MLKEGLTSKPTVTNHHRYLCGIYCMFLFENHRQVLTQGHSSAAVLIDHRSKSHSVPFSTDLQKAELLRNTDTSVSIFKHQQGSDTTIWKVLLKTESTLAPNNSPQCTNTSGVSKFFSNGMRLYDIIFMTVYFIYTYINMSDTA